MIRPYDRRATKGRRRRAARRVRRVLAAINEAAAMWFRVAAEAALAAAVECAQQTLADALARSGAPRMEVTVCPSSPSAA